MLKATHRDLCRLCNSVKTIQFSCSSVLIGCTVRRMKRLRKLVKAPKFYSVTIFMYISFIIPPFSL